MCKTSIIRELNKMKGFRQGEQNCIDRHREIKGHAWGENQFLPAPKAEVPAEYIEWLVYLSGPIRVNAQSCHWAEVKGAEPKTKTPARPKAASVANLVGGWWKNPGE